MTGRWILGALGLAVIAALAMWTCWDTFRHVSPATSVEAAAAGAPAPVSPGLAGSGGEAASRGAGSGTGSAGAEATHGSPAGPQGGGGGGALHAVRAPVVAGQFYPESARELGSMVDTMMSHTRKKPLDGDLVALLVPHAGYVFSGQVAAWGYRQIEGLSNTTFVIVGPSHHWPLDGLAVSGADGMATPLGTVPVDVELESSIRKAADGIVVEPRAHAQEHSLEVQLPFIQKVAPSARVVALAAGAIGPDLARTLGEGLAKAIRERITSGGHVFLIASSDMSHYPAAEAAEQVDGITLSHILEFRPGRLAAWEARALQAGVPELVCTLCGLGAVQVVMHAARALGADRATLIRYGNSADVPGGDATRVVGYGAVAFTRSAGSVDTQKPPEISARSGRRLLGVARASIVSALSGEPMPDLATDDAALEAVCGAFVTLREEGQLRGCVGITTPIRALIANVARAARLAAFSDPRFKPVEKAEVAHLNIEVSALSAARRVAGPKDITPGVHGVILRKGDAQGLFLPQVWGETGWDRDAFLTHLAAEKAGLPPDAWKDPASELWVFTVTAFAEPALPVPSASPAPLLPRPSPASAAPLAPHASPAPYAPVAPSHAPAPPFASTTPVPPPGRK